MRAVAKIFAAVLLTATSLPLTVASAVAQATFSRWASFTPDPRQFSTQPGGVSPLAVIGGASFVAGQYMIYVAASNPDGKSVSRWSSFGPFVLQGGDKWQASLLPGAKLRMERNPAALLPYSSLGATNAMIYVRNDDRSSWQSICVLPLGGNVRTDCFGGTSNVVYGGAGASTLSKWTSITLDQRQFAAQPGGVFPLAVLGGPSFAAGKYMIYVGASNPDGRAVSQWNQFGPFDLQGNDKWAAHLLPQSQLLMERNVASVQTYSNPGPANAMIYARNDDASSWQAICVLPLGRTVQPDCFGGSGNVVLDIKGAAGGLEDTFTGQVTLTKVAAQKVGGTGSLTLMVKAGTVTGSMTSRIAYVVREAAISGTMSSDGRITATIKGTSRYDKPKPTEKMEVLAWELVNTLVTYPFQGTFTGTVVNGQASGSFTAYRTDKPQADNTLVAGTWQASPQAK
jgi:hypothetical protein